LDLTIPAASLSSRASHLDLLDSTDTDDEYGTNASIACDVGIPAMRKYTDLSGVANEGGREGGGWEVDEYEYELSALINDSKNDTASLVDPGIEAPELTVRRRLGGGSRDRLRYRESIGSGSVVRAAPASLRSCMLLLFWRVPARYSLSFLCLRLRTPRYVIGPLPPPLGFFSGWDNWDEEDKDEGLDCRWDGWDWDPPS
jgi:hypothetical protein